MALPHAPRVGGEWRGRGVAKWPGRRRSRSHPGAAQWSRVQSPHNRPDNLTICVSFQIFNTWVPTCPHCGSREIWESILTINTMNFCNPYLTWAGSKIVPPVLLHVLRLWVSHTFLSLFFHLPLGRKTEENRKRPSKVCQWNSTVSQGAKKRDFCDWQGAKPNTLEQS